MRNYIRQIKRDSHIVDVHFLMQTSNRPIQVYASVNSHNLQIKIFYEKTSSRMKWFRKEVKDTSVLLSHVETEHLMW